jgi:hypothetical protein
MYDENKAALDSLCNEAMELLDWFSAQRSEAVTDLKSDQDFLRYVESQSEFDILIRTIVGTTWRFLNAISDNGVFDRLMEVVFQAIEAEATSFVLPETIDELRSAVEEARKFKHSRNV